MVQLMGSLHYEFEDFVEEQYGSVGKRYRFEAAPFDQQLRLHSHTSAVPPSQFNPLDEPPPLGLRLRKSSSLLDLIQMKLSQGCSASHSMKHAKNSEKNNVKCNVSSSANEKLKASNFPATLLRIGSWEYKSTYEGDLVAKCYFAKHKLVWECLEDGLKNKIEVQWSDITALKADLPENGPGSLTLVVARKPSFFHETNPQPRKHTLWQSTTDFTDGQATINKIHFIQFPPGALNKHYEKLIQCDSRLYVLSQRLELIVDHLYFDTRASAPENSGESEGNASNQLQPATAEHPSAFQYMSPSPCVQSSSSTGQFPLAVQSVSMDVSSPRSVMDKQTNEGSSLSSENRSLNALGLRSSISTDDLLKHIGNLIPEDQSDEFMENLSLLLSDTQCANSMALDEKSLMKKVNSLCCLLQDPAEENCHEVADTRNVEFSDPVHVNSSNRMQAPECNFGGSHGGELGSTMPRDSFGDLLNYLPCIASLPRFPILFGIGEENEY